ncbi:FAD-dependent oxidoreductase [Moorella sulfitireducens]|uniref:FAD-dependent oxidoreductase n=1 Tax=Neomoorella sulfitireducens TaxID=2972948 RepID=UPI0021AD34B8|nr:FAD-dependent oxidoreductase [Moorella sulfitireducens]
MIDVIETDIVVIGGGPSGFGAAVAAARKGLKVYLLESTNKIGGVLASCPGMPLGAGYPLGKSIGGIFDELVNSLYQMDPPAAEKRECSLENFGPEVVYDHEILIFTLYRMLEEAGVTLLLNATALEPIMNGNIIKGVIYYDWNRKHIINTKAVIDCSGDGYIAAKAGVPFQKGDDDGHLMGATLTFLMINTPWERIFEDNYDPYFKEIAAKGIKEGKLHPDLDKIYIMKGFHKDTVFFNTVNIKDVDGTDPLSIVRATNEARKRCHQLAKFLIEEVPGFENAIPIYMGPIVGIRETRRFEGLYRLTADDITIGKKFSDGIVCCNNPIDIVCRGSNTFTYDAIGEEGTYYTIPYRCMVPRNIKNLLFAGRIISTDPVAFASVRGMPQCMVMGQACGTAAAMAIKNNTSVQDIDYRDLVEDLINQGVNGLGDEPL